MNETQIEAPAPRDYDTLKSRILDRSAELPKRLAQVAAYALDNPDEIAFGTAASIATSAGVQPSTLVRFAQQLGFDGFTSLQAVFRERMRERNSSYEERLKALRGDGEAANSNRAMLEGFAAAASNSLEKMLRSLDDGILDRAVATLSAAETIYIVARRRASPIASHLGYALGKLGIRNALVESAVGLDSEIMSFATERDAVIAISFSPYAPATIEHARNAAARGVPVIAITDSAFSPLALSAREWFEISESDCAGFRSLSASMALAMTLAVGVAEQRREATT